MLIYDGVGDGGAMNAAQNMPQVDGRACGEDPSARDLKTAMKILQGLRFDTTRQVDLNEVEISAYEAMNAIVKTWVQRDELDENADFCEFHENCVASGLDYRYYKNTWCLAVMRNGVHLHADVTFGYNSARVLFEVEDVYREVVNDD